MKKLLTTACAIAAIVLAPASAGAQSTETSISLVHGIPDVTVDVVVAGSVVIDGVAFNTITDISSFAGRTLTDFEVVNVADQSTVIGPIASITIPSSGNWSIVAYLDATGNPTLGQFENNMAELDDDTARVTVRHTAATGPVDVIVGTQRPITNLTNGSSIELVLPSGTLAGAQLAPTGGDPISDIPTVTLDANTNNIVYAVGSPDDGTLGYVIQVVQLPTTVETTTTTTDPNATTTTTDPNATTTTEASTTTTTTAPVPVAVNTGSPIDGNGTTYVLLAAAGGLLLAGVSVLARRRV